MAKKEIINLLIKGGAATAGPPLGPKLGPMSINVGKVVAAINEKTAAMKGIDVPVKVVVDPETKTFEIEVGTPPTSALILKEAGVKKGSGKSLELKVSDIAIEQVIKVAKTKSENLLGENLKQKVKEVIGTCVSLGVKVEGKDPKQAIIDVDKGVYDKEISSGSTDVPPEKKAKLDAERARLAEEVAKAAAAKAEEKPPTEEEKKE